MAEHGRRTMAMEHMRAHFAGADDEVEIDWCAPSPTRGSLSRTPWRRSECYTESQGRSEGWEMSFALLADLLVLVALVVLFVILLMVRRWLGE